jgi:hypothetical protein
MSGGSVHAALTALRAARTALAELPETTLIRPELVAVLDEIETLTCQLPTHRHRMLAQLQTQTTAKEMGAKSWRDVLATRWRISTSEAHRRLREAADLGPRHTPIGQTLQPVLPATAIAQAHGLINAEHVTALREAMARIPAAIDADTRAQIEVDWVRAAVGLGPKELRDHAARTLFLLDQDGPEPDDRERQRRRGVTIGPQQHDAMREFKARLTPRAYAIYEVIFARLAAPGMCNPADEHPCYTGTPTQAQIDGDDRTLAQRQHDALEAVGRLMLQSGTLGPHNGLPAAIIIRTTLQDLHSRAGIGGTIMPISDVIALAGRSDQYLAVFDKATGAALDLFRARRSASLAQRLMLIAREGGCTKPGCPVPPYATQVHHAARDWAHGGNTNINELGLACGPDNRMVEPGGWATRINTYHRPEELHAPPEEANTQGEQDISPGTDHHPWGPEPNAA